MIARLHSWRQKIRQRRLAIAITTVVIVVTIALIIVGYRFDWTGFNGNNKSGKTVWDWLNLLGVLAIPVAVGLGTLWFTLQQGKVTDAENKDNQRETALQAYIDKMSELLLANRLRDSKEDEEVQKIARVRTLTVLRRLDAERKGSVLLFLHESGLIDKDKRIVDLSGADLGKARLRNANLSRADLSFTNLKKADLNGADLNGADLNGAMPRRPIPVGTYLGSGAQLFNANLSNANLSRANLQGACLIAAELIDVNLSGADLSFADLSDATVTPEQLDKAKSLKGATMPDGSKHP